MASNAAVAPPTPNISKETDPPSNVGNTPTDAAVNPTPNNNNSLVQKKNTPVKFSVGHRTISEEEIKQHLDKLDWRNSINNSSINNIAVSKKKVTGSTYLDFAFDCTNNATGKKIFILPPPLTVVAHRTSGLGGFSSKTSDKHPSNASYYIKLRAECPPITKESTEAGVTQDTPTHQKEFLIQLQKLEEAILTVMWDMEGVQDTHKATIYKQQLAFLARVKNVTEDKAEALLKKDQEVAATFKKDCVQNWITTASAFFNINSDEGIKQLDTAESKPSKVIDSFTCTQKVWIIPSGKKAVALKKATAHLDKIISDDNMFLMSPTEIYKEMSKGGYIHNRILWDDGKSGREIRSYAKEIITKRYEKLGESIKNLASKLSKLNIQNLRKTYADRMKEELTDIDNFEKDFIAENYVLQALISVEPFSTKKPGEYGVRIHLAGKAMINMSGNAVKDMPLRVPVGPEDNGQEYSILAELREKMENGEDLLKQEIAEMTSAPKTSGTDTKKGQDGPDKTEGDPEAKETEGGEKGNGTKKKDKKRSKKQKTDHPKGVEKMEIETQTEPVQVNSTAKTVDGNKKEAPNKKNNKELVKESESDTGEESSEEEQEEEKTKLQSKVKVTKAVKPAESNSDDDSDDMEEGEDDEEVANGKKEVIQASLVRGVEADVMILDETAFLQAKKRGGPDHNEAEGSNKTKNQPKVTKNVNEKTAEDPTPDVQVKKKKLVRKK